MYDVSSNYKNYLRKFDSRVSEKDSRKFYGIIINNNGMDYYIPFTSKINKKTNPKLTVNVKDIDSNKIIAKLLLNNMILVKEEESKIVDINNSQYKTIFQWNFVI